MLSMLLLAGLAEAKKPKGPPPAPPQGWHTEEGWRGECWYPAEYDKLLEGDRKMARQKALEEMKRQWSGGKEDFVSLDAGVIDDVETVLLGRPAMIENISKENLEHCMAVMKGGDTAPWQGWLAGLPSKLTAGECNTPLTYTLFDYLDIGRGWQRPVHICKGDKAKITATVKDRYRISDKGEWITAEGTPEKAIAAEFPCNIEGCTVGMVVGKFVTDDGVETIFPIGAGTLFVAPEHGTLYYSVNDTTWYDNKWFKSSTVEDKTAITIEPG